MGRVRFDPCVHLYSRSSELAGQTVPRRSVLILLERHINAEAFAYSYWDRQLHDQKTELRCDSDVERSVRGTPSVLK